MRNEIQEIVFVNYAAKRIQINVCIKRYLELQISLQILENLDI